MPIPKQKAKTVDQSFVEQVLFGAAMIIYTDQGRNFESKLFQEMCWLLGVKKTTSFNPKSNGLVEQLNKTFGRLITFV